MAHKEVPILEMSAISKSFGATKALEGVDFSCQRGEIHAILGENGAGKSTLMKLITGVIQPTSGEIRIDGQLTALSSPKQATQLGLVCMFQELSLVPDLTVQENLLLGAPGSRLGFVKKDNLALAIEILVKIDAGAIRLSQRIADLSLPARQQVEIAKAIMRRPNLLILDEATSALNAAVVDKVFDLVRAERDSGTSILFISHRFHEVEALADRISVFRNGSRVATFVKGDYDYSDIINMMVGQRIEDLFPPKPSLPPDAPEILRVENFSWNDQVKDVSLSVREGQIVGLGGLDGQGQSSFLMGLFGLLRKTSGFLTIKGKQVEITSPKAAKSPAIALAFIPEDRKSEGLIQQQTIRENLELAALGLSGINAKDTSLYQASLDRLELKHDGMDNAVESLSGGNQQKVVLSKWLALQPVCLLLADPTRGIDVKTKTQIYAILRELADQGTAILLLSTDYEELVQLCDEAHIFYGGQISKSLYGAEITAHNVIAASLNVHAAPTLAHA